MKLLTINKLRECLIGGAICLALALSSCAIPQSDSSTSQSAYPLPTTSIPTSTLLPVSTPTQGAYPLPATVTQFPVLTPTPTETRRPLGILPPVPPQGWPTGVPWPPPTIALGTPTPTATPHLFPTPAFFATPTGARPEQMKRIWFPYYPYSGSVLRLQSVLIDTQGQRWELNEQGIDLGIIEERLPSASSGSQLNSLYLSPDHQWAVVEIGFGPTFLIDLLSRTRRPIVNDPSKSVSFITWAPDSHHILGFSRSSADPVEVQFLDIFSQSSESVEFPKEQYGPYLHAAAFSPNGSKLADALMYPRIHQTRAEGWVEIGLREGVRDKRQVLTKIPTGFNITPHSLQWSQDGHKLIWIALVEAPPNPNLLWPANPQAQLWAYDLTKSNATLLTTLSKDTQYSTPAMISPNGRYVAAIKDTTPDGANISLFDLESAQEKQLTSFKNLKLSQVSWAPDGQWIAFAISRGAYSEIWLTNLNGTQYHPVAGPVAPHAPFIWSPQ